MLGRDQDDPQCSWLRVTLDNILTQQAGKAGLSGEGAEKQACAPDPRDTASAHSLSPQA